MDESLWHTGNNSYLGASGCFFLLNSIFLTLELSYCLRAECRSQLIRLEAALLGIFPKRCFCSMSSPVNIQSHFTALFPLLSWTTSLRGLQKGQLFCSLLEYSPSPHGICCFRYSLVHSNIIAALKYLARVFGCRTCSPQLHANWGWLVPVKEFPCHNLQF